MSYLYPFTKETSEKFKMVVTSHYGPRAGGLHHGVDLAPMINPYGEIPIIATIDGTIYNYVDGYGGLTCRIIGDEGQAHVTIHHRDFLKPNKSRVKVGDEIALMGTTGNSTGVHVHYEIQNVSGDRRTSVNPMKNIIYLEDIPPMQEKSYQIKMNKVKIAESTDHAEIDALYKAMKKEDDSGEDIYIRFRRILRENGKVIDDEKRKGFRIKKGKK